MHVVVAECLTAQMKKEVVCCGVYVDGICCGGGVSGFWVCISWVISSMGFGGGVVAMVYPIQAPMARMAMNAIATGAAMSQ